MALNNVIKWSPQNYADAALIAREAENELLKRLDWMCVDPRVVVDLGCGVGGAGEQLKKRYRKAQVIAVDNCMAMLSHRQTISPNSVCADATLLPFADMQVDLIFANFLIPWHAQFESLLQECCRVLRADGLLLFTALGPDSLKEIKSSVSATSLPFLLDMHEFGDALLANKFSDPVLDVTHLNVSYRSNRKLIEDLVASGMLNGNEIDALADVNTTIEEITYEVIFAHAFAPPLEVRTVQKDGVVNVSLSQFRKMVSGKSS